MGIWIRIKIGNLDPDKQKLPTKEKKATKFQVQDVLFGGLQL
jgi:hypothetical protein